MTAFSLKEGERLIINDPHAKWIMTPMKAVPGTLRVTGDRIVFERPEHAYFGVFKKWMKFLAAEVLFEVRRTDIVKADKVMAGENKRLVLESLRDRPKVIETIKADTIAGELNKHITQSKS